MTFRPTKRVLGVAGALVLAIGLLIAAATIRTSSGPAHGSAAADALSNPDLDPGTPLSAPAPNFTLTDQFGRKVSLRSFRGKVVLLAFNDPVCTTVCPLTTTAMVEAKAMLGAAGSRVQLLGVAANPTDTAVKWVRAYSVAHQMTYRWDFLTGSLPQLKRVWRGYGIEAELVRGQVDHTPALYVINRRGRLSRLYMTQMAYSSVDQLAQELAQSAAALLPEHPRIRDHVPYSEVQLLDPGTSVRLPRVGGGSVQLGPSGSPHLFLFFGTWNSEVTDLAKHMEMLNRYQAMTPGSKLPPLTAVDEATVEPSASALPHFLHALRAPLSYPVAIDQSGRVGDGYRVQDEPWLELISGSGQFLWYHDVSTGGWPSNDSLIQHIRLALARAPRAYPTGSTGPQIPGSPAALAALHAQADQLLGSGSLLYARIHALRGYPVVVNVWASWCGPCQAEFSLFGSASRQYGARVAFLGADTNDSAGDARNFLQQHHVSYPSYPTTTSLLRPLAIIQGFPTTVFINRAGKVVDVHTGQYISQSALDQDIRTYALTG
jgi:cytochrome oxidase Cu insertion factor (SCO1/SenC/PrrC family)/thiol-disulfide isomerase/thioredoxin